MLATLLLLFCVVEWWSLEFSGNQKMWEGEGAIAPSLFSPSLFPRRHFSCQKKIYARRLRILSNTPNQV